MTPRPAQRPATDLSEVRRIASEGRVEAALTRLDQILGRNPGDAGIQAAVALLRSLAREADAAGDAGAAVVLLGTAVRLAPAFADLHHQYALALLARQQRTEARQALDRALRINPGYLAARIERALLDAREGLLAESLDALRALANDPRLEEPAAFQQGLRRLQQADWDGAGSLIRRACKLSDPLLDGVLERYHALMDAGDAARAAQVVRDVLPRFSGYPDLHFLLASAELRDGAIDDAIVSFARALELNPGFHGARLELARALEAAGQVVQAREQVTLVLEQRPGDPQALDMQARWAAPGHRANAIRAAGQKQA